MSVVTARTQCKTIERITYSWKPSTRQKWTWRNGKCSLTDMKVWRERMICGISLYISSSNDDRYHIHWMTTANTTQIKSTLTRIVWTYTLMFSFRAWYAQSRHNKETIQSLCGKVTSPTVRECFRSRVSYSRCLVNNLGGPAILNQRIKRERDRQNWIGPSRMNPWQHQQGVNALLSTSSSSSSSPACSCSSF